VPEAGDDFVRRVYEGFNRGELGSALELLDPGFEFREPTDFPGAHEYRGRDGFVEALRNATSVFDDVNVAVERVIEAGDRLVVFIHITGVGKESGAPVQLRAAHVWTMDGGRAVRMRVYLDRTEALEAAGLREQG
jgi:ketosteroid isomerase-like protein